MGGLPVSENARKNAVNQAALLCALTERAGRGEHRFHMPGHKGRLDAPFADTAAIDFTELDGTGNLYTDTDGPIREAERRCAGLYGAHSAMLLTGGATQGVGAMLAATTRPGDWVAVDRACHRSVMHAMALLDLTPYYLPRRVLRPFGLPLALSPAELPPQVRCVWLTSPGYYGTLSETKGWPVPVLADAAHGAHLPFLPDGVSPLGGAAIAVCSAHKTLPALGQAAFLLVSESVDAERLRFGTALFGTTSPSYAVMASADAAFAGLARDGAPRWAGVHHFAEALRERFPSLLSRRHLPGEPGLDTARLCVFTGDGYGAALRLEREFGMVCEMADSGNVLLILTPNDPPEAWDALERGLAAVCPPEDPACSVEEPPPLPRRRMSLREALLGGCEAIPLRRCAGRIAARPIAPYPPGIPLIAPGEEIEKLHIEMLCELWYNEYDRDTVIQVTSDM